MKYKIVTPASSLPVSVADMKTHLRETSPDLDGLIEGYIEAAVQLFEQRTNKCIMPQTWKLTLDDSEVVERVEIFKYPILGFSSITYYDADNAVQSLTNSQDDYISFIDGRPGSLIFDDPPTTYERDDAMSITFLAGYDTVPNDILLAIKMLVWRMYVHPDDPVSERLSFVDRIVRDHRAWQ
jgi:uncharacterized phiE125 gp8 family phage protein